MKPERGNDDAPEGTAALHTAWLRTVEALKENEGEERNESAERPRPVPVDHIEALVPYRGDYPDAPETWRTRPQAENAAGALLCERLSRGDIAVCYYRDESGPAISTLDDHSVWTEENAVVAFGRRVLNDSWGIFPRGMVGRVPFISKADLDRWLSIELPELRGWPRVRAIPDEPAPEMPPAAPVLQGAGAETGLALQPHLPAPASQSAAPPSQPIASASELPSLPAPATPDPQPETIAPARKQKPPRKPTKQDRAISAHFEAHPEQLAELRAGKLSRPAAVNAVIDEIKEKHGAKSAQYRAINGMKEKAMRGWEARNPETTD